MNEKTIGSELSRLSHLMGIDPFLWKEIRSIQQQSSDQIGNLCLHDIDNTIELILAANVMFNFYQQGCVHSKSVLYIRDCLFMSIYRVYHPELSSLNIIPGSNVKNITSDCFEGSLIAFAKDLDYKLGLVSKVLEKISPRRFEMPKLEEINKIKSKLYIFFKKINIDQDFKKKLTVKINDCHNAFFALNLLEKIYKYLRYTNEFNGVSENDKKYFLGLMMSLIFSQKTSDIICCLEKSLDFFDLPNLNILPDMVKYLNNDISFEVVKKRRSFFDEIRENLNIENFPFKSSLIRE